MMSRRGLYDKVWTLLFESGQDFEEVLELVADAIDDWANEKANNEKVADGMSDLADKIKSALHEFQDADYEEDDEEDEKD